MGTWTSICCDVPDGNPPDSLILGRDWEPRQARVSPFKGKMWKEDNKSVLRRSHFACLAKGRNYGGNSKFILISCSSF